MKSAKSGDKKKGLCDLCGRTRSLALKAGIVAVLAVGLVFGLGGAAQARLTGPGGIICPTGPHPTLGRDWAPGDEYHLVFVTSTRRDATSGNIADYNAFVNTAANSAGSLVAGHGVTWYAIASTGTVAAKDNAVVSAPVYRVDLELVAKGCDDMWDRSIAAPISVNEKGETEERSLVWTGSNPEGGLMINGTPKDWWYFNAVLGSPQFRPGKGVLDSTDLFWIAIWWKAGAPKTLLPMYAISGPLTIILYSVPVPEPAGLGLGLAGLALFAVRRKRS